MKTEAKANRLNSPAKDAQSDFAQFKGFMRRLMSVPHSEIKAKLEAEKKLKKASVSRASV
jgi:hypothetical protein